MTTYNELGQSLRSWLKTGSSLSCDFRLPNEKIEFDNAMLDSIPMGLSQATLQQAELIANWAFDTAQGSEYERGVEHELRYVSFPVITGKGLDHEMERIVHTFIKKRGEDIDLARHRFQHPGLFNLLVLNEELSDAESRYDEPIEVNASNLVSVEWQVKQKRKMMTCKLRIDPDSPSWMIRNDSAVIALLNIKLNTHGMNNMILPETPAKLLTIWPLTEVGDEYTRRIQAINKTSVTMLPQIFVSKQYASIRKFITEISQRDARIVIQNMEKIQIQLRQRLPWKSSSTVSPQIDELVEFDLQCDQSGEGIFGDEGRNFLRWAGKGA